MLVHHRTGGPFTTAVHASPTVRNCRGFHATCGTWPDPKTAVADYERKSDLRSGSEERASPRRGWWVVGSG
ncbi:MAG: hypothetical protein ACHBN1_10550 [Heteroscytonema crispum UTEX LB 1556]